jgi:hypothetical protein
MCHVMSQHRWDNPYNVVHDWCHAELYLSYWGDKILYDFITEWLHLYHILSLQICCIDIPWCNGFSETYLVVEEGQYITFSFPSNKPVLWIIFKSEYSGLRYTMLCCWVSGWLSTFQKNECRYLQGEEAIPILWYVRTQQQSIASWST